MTRERETGEYLSPQLVTVRGECYWRSTVVGPRKGCQAWYQAALPEEAAPSPWRYWARTAKQVLDCGGLLYKVVAR